MTEQKRRHQCYRCGRRRAEDAMEQRQNSLYGRTHWFCKEPKKDGCVQAFEWRDQEFSGRRTEPKPR